MKIGTTDKVKFKKLQMRLRLTKWQVMGVLESIWWLTMQNAPAGDIGKISNEDICILIEWEDDADDLIAALVDTGWLDESDEYRLIVHDWSEHCPNHIKGAFARYNKTFADAKHVLGTSQAHAEPVEETTTIPSQAISTHTLPSHSQPKTGAAGKVAWLDMVKDSSRFDSFCQRLGASSKSDKTIAAEVFVLHVERDDLDGKASAARVVDLGEQMAEIRRDKTAKSPMAVLRTRAKSQYGDNGHV